MREYKDCYIAVLDLLGFKCALNKYDCETIASFFDEVNNEYIISFDKTKKPIVDHKDIHIKVMSDTVCIYIETSIPNALTALIATCDYLQIRMLCLEHPILLRGAIVRGDLYHYNDVIFGNGFVKAYKMQEEEAVYPRVIIDNETLEGYTPYDEAGKKYLDKNMIVDCVDSKYVSDYLFIFYGLNHEKESWKNFSKFVYRKAECENNERIREKYIYLKNQFQRVSEKYLNYLEES